MADLQKSSNNIERYQMNEICHCYQIAIQSDENQISHFLPFIENYSVGDMRAPHHVLYTSDIMS